GGILSFVLAIVQVVRGSFSAFALVAVSIVLFYWGAYKAWAKEREKLREEIARNGKPEIKIRLLGALHHVLALDNALYLGPSFVTVHVGLVNIRQVPTTIKGCALKIFLGP